MINESLPERFYKYIDWKNRYQRKILLNDIIYFASPPKLNDPFDSNIRTRYDKKTHGEILEDYKNAIRRLEPNLDLDEIKRLAEETFKNPNHFSKICQDTDEQDKIVIEMNAGVFSVSRVPNNILMWSHYCDSHKGLCIGFDANELFKFLSAYFEISTTKFACAPISYQSQYPLILPNMPEVELDRTKLFTKADCWQYEEEWRYFIWGETNREVTLPNDIIVEVIIGCRTPENERSEVLKLIKDKKPQIEIKEAIPNNVEFKFDLNPITSRKSILS